jgi:hypothetical protein
MKEDSAFGPGMMFGIPGPGPKKDTKGIPSDPKKEKGKTIKKMKNIPTFEDFIFEAKGPDPREIKKAVKDFMSRTKFVRNMLDMNWRLPSEPIVITNKDLDIKGSATGNYLITGVYSKYGPKYMVEFYMAMPNPKFPKTLGVFTKEFDKNVWEKFVADHDKQLLQPRELNAKTITDASVFVEQFITNELNSIFGSTDSSAEVQSDTVLGEFQKFFKAAEVTEISDNRLRLNYWFKRAGDGSAVPKTNLFFIVDPQHRTVEFKNPDKRTPIQDTYTDLRDLHRIIGDMISVWKAEDRGRLNAAKQSAFNLDR